MTCVKVLKSSGKIVYRCYRKCQIALVAQWLIIADYSFSSKVISHSFILSTLQIWKTVYTTGKPTVYYARVC